MLAALPATLSSRLSVPHMWEHTLYAQPPAPRGVQVPLSREPTTLLAPLFVQTQGLFPKPKAVILPVVNFGHPQSNGPGPIATADSDLLHHQFRLSPLQWKIQNVPVCTFKTSPCVPAPRAHVSTHVRVVPVHTGTF